MIANSFGLPLYENYVTVLAVSNKLRISIGPSTLPGVEPNAILNGLEIMKIKHFRSTPNSDSNKDIRKVAICVRIGGFLVVILVSFTHYIEQNSYNITYQTSHTKSCFNYMTM